MPPLLSHPARAASVAVLLTVGSALPGAATDSLSFDNWLLAPVRIHLLAASNAPAIHTSLTETDLERILRKINGIWSQAGISFWLEKIVREDALNPSYSATMGKPGDLRGLLSLRPETTKATNVFHLYFVKRFSANGVFLGEAMFVKDTASLRHVPGGIDEPLPRVSSHEIGHALTLQHCTNEHHLMFRGTTGTNLDAIEIKQAQDAATKLPWVKSAPTVVKNAAEARRSRNIDQARWLYSQIAIIPLEHRAVRAARRRATVPSSQGAAAGAQP